MNFLVKSCLLFVCTLPLIRCDGIIAQSGVPHFANGIKIGEVDQNSAVLWVRLTRDSEAAFDKLKIFTQGLPARSKASMPMPEDVVPGLAGQIQVQYWAKQNPQLKKTTEWMTVASQNDFSHQFELSGLLAGTEYELEIAARANEVSKQRNRIRGQFKTAPDPARRESIRFIVSTCQAIRSIDSDKKGHRAYRQMLALQPDFFVHTGDILYYDKVPLCKNATAARSKWHLMFAYQYNQDFHRNVASYFMKDDHDTLKNDCWPGQTYGKLTFQQGLEIFRQQLPFGKKKTYRTVRWGKDVQVWLTENRDFRSSNRMADGPNKTILGKKQKDWLMKTIAESDATFKFVISPGPVVGPDKKGKNDNHSNPGFQFEGQQLRDFLSKQQNTFVICGDRHWQYCSKDPGTGLIEMGCGPINDQHNFGGNPGRNKTFHRYFGSKGGFLMVSVDGEIAKAEWFHANDSDWQPGKVPRVLHTEQFRGDKLNSESESKK